MLRYGLKKIVDCRGNQGRKSLQLRGGYRMLVDNEDYTYRDLSTVNLKEKFSYKEIISAYVKALFYENKQWIMYLEKNHVKEVDKKKFKKLVSRSSLTAREKYFETGEGKLNEYIRSFIDKYDRFKTNTELYSNNLKED